MLSGQPTGMKEPLSLSGWCGALGMERWLPISRASMMSERPRCQIQRYIIQVKVARINNRRWYCTPLLLDQKYRGVRALQLQERGCMHRHKALPWPHFFRYLEGVNILALARITVAFGEDAERSELELEGECSRA